MPSSLPRVDKFVEAESRMLVARGWGRGNGELLFTGYRVSVLQDEKSAGDGWHNSVNVLNTTEL